jgi:hypothetical protein
MGKIDYRAPQRVGKRIPTPQDTTSKSTNHLKVVFSFEKFDYHKECPSTWEKEEIKQLFSTFNKASCRTWQQVLETSGKAKHDGKTGLGFTEIRNNSSLNSQFGISQDIIISEMRVTERARFFGFRSHQIYFLLCLDKNHAKCK